MKRKFLIIMLACLSVFACVFGFAACNIGNTGGGSEGTQVTVTYDANGGTFADGSATLTQKVDRGSTLTAPTSPSNAGSVFGGWAKGKVGKNLWQFATDKVTENTTLFAVWEEQSASIISADGASIDDKKMSVFMVVDKDTESVSLANKIVCNSNSVWKLYYDKLGQIEIPTKIASGKSGALSAGDNIFYIVVTASGGSQTNVYELTIHRSFQVTITFYDNKGKEVNTDTTYTGEKYSIYYNLSLSGYTFNGWKDENGTKVTSLTLFENAKLYADCTAKTYGITLDVNEGDALEKTDYTATYDSGYSLAVPTRTGYSFAGWYYGSTQVTNSNGVSLEDWTYTHDKEFTAKWTPNRYQVTLNKDVDGGTVSGDGSHNYKSEVTIRANTGDGYTWLGWYDKDGKPVTTEYTYTFKMGFGAEYTAKWIACPVTFEKNIEEAGSITYPTATVAGQQYSVTAETNHGYTWLGWYNGDTELTTENSYTYTMPSSPADAVTYTAKWTLATVTTATNNRDAGTYTIKNKVVTAVGERVELTAKTNNGYTWLGWYDGETQLTADFDYTFEMPEDSVLYTAKWLKAPTVSSSDSTAGTVSGMPATTVAGQTVTLSAETKKLGYVWLGWFNGDEKLSEEYTFDFTIPSSDEITYDIVAKWETDKKLDNFIYTLNSTSFTITGIKDKTVTEIDVPEYVTSISQGAFSGCTNVESLTLPFVTFTSRYSMGYIFGEKSYTGAVAATQYYYQYWNWKTVTFYIPSTLKSITVLGKATKIDAYAFVNLSGVTSITISEGVTSIGNNAFQNCSGLTSIVIPDSVTTIDYNAFKGCGGLKSVKLGSGLKEIGTDAFAGCSALEEFITDENNSVYSSEAGILYNKSKTHIQFVPKAISGSVILPESLTSIGEYSFSGCTDITSIKIPDRVTSIYSYAFYGCTGLNEIIVPDRVTSIGRGAFLECTGLESITLPLLSYWNNGKTYTHFGYIFSAGTKDENAEFVPVTLKTVIITGGESIGDSAFYNCSGLTSIKIPDSITTIGASAFSGCSGLTSIKIPDSVTTIGASAFSGCSGLKSMEIPDRVTAIGASAFYNCVGLTSIKISNKVTSIGYDAFQNCAGLTSIVIPDSVITIGSGAFWGCSRLTSIVIPDSVTSIGGAALGGCAALESLTLPFVGSDKNITSDSYLYPLGYIFGQTAYEGGIETTQEKREYGLASTTSVKYYIPETLKSVTVTNSDTLYGYEFYNCTGLTSITISDTTTSIGTHAFYHCNSLEYLSIPYVGQQNNFGFLFGAYTNYEKNPTYVPQTLKTVIITGGKSLGEKAFVDLTGIENVIITGGITSIDDYVFSGCAGLKSITISDSVTSIGYYAFTNCSSLESITVDNNNLNYSSQDGILYNKEKTQFILIPTAIKGDITIPDGITSIGYNLFNGRTNITSVKIPDGVTSIGSYAFQNCSSLLSIEIPKGVTSIGTYAFQNCSSLLSIEIPKGVTSIGTKTFEKCNNLKSIIIPDGVTSIGNYAFSDCNSLTNVEIPDGVTAIGSSAFSGCNSLTSVGIPKGVTEISDYVFSGCTQLTSITIPDGVTSIGNYAFQKCSSLKSIEIPNSVTAISYAAFTGCGSLEKITLPFVGKVDENTGVLTSPFGYIFGDVRYEGAMEIKQRVPYQSGTYYSYTYYLPAVLKTVIITNGESIADNVFYNCSGLESIEIPNGVKTIGASAFRNCTGLTSIAIPDSVTTIGDFVFTDCTGLTSITIPDSVTSVGKFATGCVNLESLTIPFVGMAKDGTENTHFSYVFEAIDSTQIATKIPERLKTVTITGGTGGVTIYSDAFNGCGTIENIIVLDGVTEIGKGAFSGCTGISSITLPFVGATKDDEMNDHFGYIFGAKSTSEHSRNIPVNLKTVIITGGTTIGMYAFDECKSIEKVILPESITEIHRTAVGSTTSSSPNIFIYYCGTKESGLNIVGDGGVVASLLAYYSETKPEVNEDGEYDANYWHYVDGVATLWTL